ncbi:protein obstructor-E-like [Ornithodoros turicata]|uniref:protein obstructor-E-like n=1 Tax=Ornithodoros turicata TaxID=34597 RepID=UPI003138CDAF
MRSYMLILVAAAVVCIASAQKSNSARDSGCRKDNGLFEHEQYCDYYYECENGVATLQLCPNGLAFAGKNRGLRGNCDYPHRVECPDDEGRVMGQSPISTENCHWQYGVFAHQTSCTRYWQCWNGTSTIQQCPFSLLYNDVMHACDWPDNVPDCQKHPICKDNPNGHLPIEKSCVRYWLCVGGYPRLQRCPAGLAFNPTSSRCELADNVPGCEPPPTTQPPEDQAEEPQQQRPQQQRPRQSQAARPVPVQAVQQRPAQQRFVPQAAAQAAPVVPVASQEDNSADYADNSQESPLPQARPQAIRRSQFRQAGK